MALPWHDGIDWRTDIVGPVAMSPEFLAITVDFFKQASNVVRDDQDDLCAHYIKAATAMGERVRGEHVSPKTMTLTLSAFPAGAIEIADVPVLEIVSVGYYDDAGDLQAYNDESPHTWIVESGGRSRRARLSPPAGESWPTAATRNDAVVVTFTVGYLSADDVPVDIKQAITVTAGEFYKSPDLSNADSSEANVLTLERFWPKRWSNAL